MNKKLNFILICGVSVLASVPYLKAIDLTKTVEAINVKTKNITTANYQQTLQQLDTEIFNKLPAETQQTIKNRFALKYSDYFFKRDIHRLPGHKKVVTAVAITPNGKRAISSSQDSTIKLWNLETGSLIHTFLTTVIPLCIAITPNAKYAAVGFTNGNVAFYNLQQFKRTQLFTDHTMAVTTITITDDGSTAISSSKDKTVRKWNIGGSKNTLGSHKNSVMQVTLHTNNNLVTSIDSKNQALQWNRATNQKTALGNLNKRATKAIAIAADTTIAISGNTNNALVWDIKTGKTLGNLSGHDALVTALTITPNAQKAVSGSIDATLRIWNVANFQQIAPPINNFDKTVTALALTPDGSKALSGAQDGSLTLWNVRTPFEQALWKRALKNVNQ